ncbi:MAG: hypothetical protein DRI01_10805 [Chloroflexi bacterium]|nr:MAG: hypothetical protein DRI01_10805 [Chloroflexota bacterium]
MGVKAKGTPSLPQDWQETCLLKGRTYPADKGALTMLILLGERGPVVRSVNNVLLTNLEGAKSLQAYIIKRIARAQGGS